MTNTITNNIRILIVDDHASVRESYAIALQLEDHIEVIDTAENGQQAIEKYHAWQPDIVLMDVHMPIMNGLEATRIIKKNDPNSRILMLSLETEAEHVQALMQAGAMGYAVKSISLDELIKAIEIAYKGGTYLSPEASIGLFQAKSPLPSTTTESQSSSVSVCSLTKRERDVLRLLCQGLRNKQIARKLNIADSTVMKHRENIREKLDLHTVAELVRYAIKHKLCD